MVSAGSCVRHKSNDLVAVRRFITRTLSDGLLLADGRGHPAAIRRLHKPIAWDLADATKIAKMITLDGVEAFPSSAAVGRAVAAKILSEPGALMKWGAQNFCLGI